MKIPPMGQKFMLDMKFMSNRRDERPKIQQHEVKDNENVWIPP